MKHVTRKQLDAILESAQKDVKMSESMIDSMLNHIGVNSEEAGGHAEKVRQDVKSGAGAKMEGGASAKMDKRILTIITTCIVKAAKLGKDTGNAKAKAKRTQLLHKAVETFASLFANNKDFDTIKKALRDAVVKASSETPPKEVAQAVLSAYRDVCAGKYGTSDEAKAA